MIIGKIIYNEEEGRIVWDEKFLTECEDIQRLKILSDVMTNAEDDFHVHLDTWLDESIHRKKRETLHAKLDDSEYQKIIKG
tara:strand:- start:9 stop:251 length:243 start_codon:yes stop_codon:yes gene_type:complete